MNVSSWGRAFWIINQEFIEKNCDGANSPKFSEPLARKLLVGSEKVSDKMVRNAPFACKVWWRPAAAVPFFVVPFVCLSVTLVPEPEYWTEARSL